MSCVQVWECSIISALACAADQPAAGLTACWLLSLMKAGSLTVVLDCPLLCMMSLALLDYMIANNVALTLE